MIKRFFALLLCAALLPAAAFAKELLPHNKKLENAALLAPVLQTEYCSWQLYQPEAMETCGLDMTDDPHFGDRHFFPVVAARDGKAVLILLKRADSGWQVDTINENALNRPGWCLTRFSMDENNSPNDAELNISFDFSTETGGDFSHCLHLSVSRVYPSHFDSLSLRQPAKSAEHLFADFCTVVFEYDRGFTFIYDYSNPQIRLSYSTLDYSPEAQCDVNAFNLSLMPLTVFDTMRPAVVSSETGCVPLLQFPDPSAPALCQIPSGAAVLREQNQWDFQYQDFILISYNQLLGYVHKADLML